MRRESWLIKIWNILWPLTIYLLAQNVLMIVWMVIAKENYEKYVSAAILSAAMICIPIYYRMYREDRISAREKRKNKPLGSQDLAFVILSGASLALLMNNVISITPLPYLFNGYEEVNDVIYGGGYILQILGAGIFCCIVEELSMRGIVYLRIRRYWGKNTALVVSALIFGVYHLNLVQGVYAFFLGLFFAWIFEKYDTLWAPIIAHISANLFIIILSGSDVLGRLMSTWFGFCLVTGIALLVFYFSWHWLKENGQCRELEFVEKDADNIKDLAQEYKRKTEEEEKE